MKKSMERKHQLRAAEKVLEEEVGQEQHTAVYSWSCGNNDRTSNNQDKIDRLTQLITKVLLAARRGGKTSRSSRRSVLNRKPSGSQLRRFAKSGGPVPLVMLCWQNCSPRVDARFFGHFGSSYGFAT